MGYVSSRVQSEVRVEVNCGGCGMKLERMSSITY